jgi:hypothetical protein
VRWRTLHLKRFRIVIGMFVTGTTRSALACHWNLVTGLISDQLPFAGGALVAREDSGASHRQIAQMPLSSISIVRRIIWTEVDAALLAHARKRLNLEHIPVRGVRLHVHASYSLTPVPFLSDACLHGTTTKATDTSEMNMFRQLIVVSAIAAAALVLIRLNPQRTNRRDTDEAARADWESEGGSSAAPRESAEPST